jgi:hypothetical protein
VRALLRAQSEARPRCDARHAKSGKQVRALIPLQPSTVVDYESCEIGDEQGVRRACALSSADRREQGSHSGEHDRLSA